MTHDDAKDPGGRFSLLFGPGGLCAGFDKGPSPVPTPLGDAVRDIAARLSRESAADRDIFARAWLQATGVPTEEAVMEERVEYSESGTIRRLVTIRRKDDT